MTTIRANLFPGITLHAVGGLFAATRYTPKRQLKAGPGKLAG